MINFRFHLISLVAVFLALGIGVAAVASFIDFFRLAPGTVGERRRIRRSALVPDRRVLAALGDRPD